nr:hypothetical protein [Tanacetum cinerariifolium]
MQTILRPINTPGQHSAATLFGGVTLFGTILTVIRVDVSTIVPVVLEVTAVVALPARVLDLDIHATSENDLFEDPSSPVHALATPITSLFLCSYSFEPSGDLSDSDSPDSLSPPDPHETAFARWRSKVSLHSLSSETSSPSSPSTPVLPSTTIASHALCQIVPAPPGIPRRSAILVLPGQEVHLGRPYHTQPNGVLKMLTARKKVHSFLARIPTNRRRFHSSSSSPPHKRRRSSPYLSSSDTHSSSPMSAGPSRMRCRSPTIDSPHIRAEPLPPRKRLRDPSSTYYHEVSVEVSTKRDIEDSIKTRAEGDIKRDTESYINSDILADIEADIAAEAATTIEADVATDIIVAVEADVEPVEAEVDAEPSVEDTVEIAVDVVAKPIVPDDLPVAIVRERLDEFEEVVQGIYEHLMDIHAQRLDDIEEEQRAHEDGAVTIDTERARLLDRIRVLEGSNIGLQDALGVERERERERTASVERRLGYMLEELRVMTIIQSGMTPEVIKELINQCVAEALVLKKLTVTLVLSLEVKISMETRKETIKVEEMKMVTMDEMEMVTVEEIEMETVEEMEIMEMKIVTKWMQGVVGLARWFEKMESVYRISNCLVDSQVKFATCTLLDGALTWWNSHVQTVGIDGAMVPEKEDKIERYIWGLPDNIQGNVTSYKPTRLQDVINMANGLMDQKVHAYATRNAENKRKLENTLRDNRVQ